VALFFLCPNTSGDSGCGCSTTGETTRWGGNQVVIRVEKKSYKQLHGIVELTYQKPMKGALVEILTNPDHLLKGAAPWDKDAPGQQRVAACVTGVDGRFCFRDLAPGAYELRSSFNSEWDVTHVYAVLDPKRGTTGRMVVDMVIGN
jgi:hypothetical protein